MPRIIAGLWRGRPLRAPAGTHTRPTADRVKEAVFSSIQYRVTHAAFLDVCAGTGGMGLEALSRGAARADLVEPDRRACGAIEANIRTLGCDRAVLHPLTWERALPRLTSHRYDLIYVDPPYRDGAAIGRAVAEALDAHDMVHADSVLIQETSAEDPIFDYSDCGWVMTRAKTYGDTRILYYHRQTTEAGEESIRPTPTESE